MNYSKPAENELNYEDIYTKDMPNYLKINGQLCVNTKEFGYITVQDYVALQHAEKSIPTPKQSQEDLNKANCMRLTNTHPELLSQEEVLDVFINYVEKYKKDYTIFDIPVGTKYIQYSEYIFNQLNTILPEIKWRKLYQSDTTIMCRGEYR